MGLQKFESRCVKNRRTYCVYLNEKIESLCVGSMRIFLAFAVCTYVYMTCKRYKKVVEKSAKKGAGTPNQNNTKRRCMSTEPTQKHHTKRSHKVENKKLDKLCGK
eukprot:745610_1